VSLYWLRDRAGHGSPALFPSIGVGGSCGMSGACVVASSLFCSVCMVCEVRGAVASCSTRYVRDSLFIVLGAPVRS